MEFCSICFIEKPYLLRVCGTRAAEDRNIKEKIEYTLNVEIASLGSAKVCTACLRLIEKFYIMKLNAHGNVSLPTVDSLKISLEHSYTIDNSIQKKPIPGFKGLTLEDHTYSSQTDKEDLHRPL